MSKKANKVFKLGPMEAEKSLSSIIFNNLKELITAKNAAHESMFKFHWKKMWPFCLLWPQVDFIRIERFMATLTEQCEDQKKFINGNINKATKEEIEFLKAVPAYLDALTDSCKKLAIVARYRQDLLEKKEKKDVFKFNDMLKAYEDSQKALVTAGAFVQVAWGTLKTAQA